MSQGQPIDRCYLPTSVRTAFKLPCALQSTSTKGQYQDQSFLLRAKSTYTMYMHTTTHTANKLVYTYIHTPAQPSPNSTPPLARPQIARPEKKTAMPRFTIVNGPHQGTAEEPGLYLSSRDREMRDTLKAEKPTAGPLELHTFKSTCFVKTDVFSTWNPSVCVEDG